MSDLAGGFLQGFADSYAREHRAKLERNLAQRGQLADLGLQALQQARPEAQLKIITNLSRLIGADPSKKIDKDLMDISTWLTPPEGYGQEEPTAPPPSFRTGSEMVSPGAGAADSGISLPQPGGGFAGPEYAMTSQPTGEGPMLGMSPFNQPAPPAYSPFYSPEEKAQMAAAAAEASAGARVRGEYGARRPMGEELGLTGEDLAAFIAGRAPLTARLRPMQFTDAKGNSVVLNYDNLMGVYLDGSGNVTDIAGLTPVSGAAATRLGDIVPDKASPTGWSRKIYGRDGAVVRLEQGAAPPVGYAPTVSTREGVDWVQTGNEVVPYGTTETTRTERPLPGQTAQPGKPGVRPVGEGLPRALPSNVVSANTQKQVLIPAVKKMQEISTRLITENAAALQAAKSAGTSIEAALGNVPDWKTYQSARKTLSLAIAAIVNQGRPTEEDRQAVAAMLPDPFTDTMDSAKQKWEFLDILMGTPGILSGTDTNKPGGGGGGAPKTVTMRPPSGSGATGTFEVDPSQVKHYEDLGATRVTK